MTEILKNNPKNRLKLAKCIVEDMPGGLHSESIKKLLSQWEGNDSLWYSDVVEWYDELSEFDEKLYDETQSALVDESDELGEYTLDDYLEDSSVEEIDDRLASDKEK